MTGHYRLVVGIVALLILMCAGSTCVAAPYSSYTYDYWENDVPAPQAYIPVRSVSGSALGIGDFRGLRDIFVDVGLDIYILDSGNRRIVHLDRDWNVKGIIDRLHYSDGREDSLNDARGLYVCDKGNIYVADTGNRRVVKIDSQGGIVSVFGRPESSVEGVIPESLQYYPTKLCVDKSDRMYVISRGVYDGVLEFSGDGEFSQFFGAPAVAPSLSDIFWNRIATREQRDRMARFLPTEYSSIDMDDRGFMFLTIAEGELAKTEPIRYLSPGGESVLRKLGFTDPIGDTSYDGQPRFVDVAARSDGLYSALELNRGRVFTYDSSGYLLYVFGARGRQFGAIDVPVAIESSLDAVFVVDGATDRIMVYEPTEYGKLIHRALQLYHGGDYENSARAWGKVLELNANYDRAYSGIALNKLMNEEFESSMDYSKLGNDRQMYSKAYRLYRKDIVSEYLGRVLTAVLILLALVYVGFRTGFMAKAAVTLKQGFHRLDERLCGNDGVVRAIWDWIKDTISGIAYSAYTVMRPFDAFWRIKHEGRGGIPSSVLVIFVGAMSLVSVQQYTGFALNPRDLKEINIYREVLTLIVPFLLWCVINWSLTTLMGGKGNLRDIFIASSYALVPLILINIPATVLSNFMTIEEGSFYYLLLAFAYAWALIMLVIGTMVVHDYDVVKTLYTSVFTCVGMGIALFVAAFVFVLADQIVAFGGDVYKEITLRR